MNPWDRGLIREYGSSKAAEAAIESMKQWQTAFEAMREALHQTCDRLERSDFPEGGDTERVLNQAYDALALADKVARPLCPDAQDYESEADYKAALRKWKADKVSR